MAYKSFDEVIKARSANNNTEKMKYTTFDDVMKDRGIVVEEQPKLTETQKSFGEFGNEIMNSAKPTYDFMKTPQQNPKHGYVIPEEYKQLNVKLTNPKDIEIFNKAEKARQDRAKERETYLQNILDPMSDPTHQAQYRKDVQSTNPIIAGMIQGAANVADTGRKLDNLGRAFGGESAIPQRLSNNIFEEERNKVMENKSFMQNIPENLASTITQMLPSIATGGVLGLGQTGVIAGAQNSQQALDDGASAGQAAAYGAITGTAEALYEKLFGFVPGLKGLSGNALSKFVTGNAKKTFTNSALDFGKKTLGEGLEEVIMEPTQQIAKGLLYDNSVSFNPANLDTYGDNGAFPLKRMAQAGLMGTLAGGIMGSVQLPAQITESRAMMQDLQNNIEQELTVASNMPTQSKSYQLAEQMVAGGKDNINFANYSNLAKTLRAEIPTIQVNPAFDKLTSTAQSLPMQSKAFEVAQKIAQKPNASYDDYVSLLSVLNSDDVTGLDTAQSSAIADRDSIIQGQVDNIKPIKLGKLEGQFKFKNISYENAMNKYDAAVLYVQDKYGTNDIVGAVSDIVNNNAPPTQRQIQVTPEYALNYIKQNDGIDMMKLADNIQKSEGALNVALDKEIARMRRATGASSPAQQNIVQSITQKRQLLNMLKGQQNQTQQNATGTQNNFEGNFTPQQQENVFMGESDASIFGGGTSIDNTQQNTINFTLGEQKQIKDAGRKAYTTALQQKANNNITRQQIEQQANVKRVEAENNERNKITQAKQEAQYGTQNIQEPTLGRERQADSVGTQSQGQANQADNTSETQKKAVEGVKNYSPNTDVSGVTVVENETSVQKSSREFVNSTLGLNVVFFEGAKDAPNGFYLPKDPTTLYINADNSDTAIARSVSHESFHALKNNDPAKWNELVDFITNNMDQKQLSDYANSFEKQEYTKFLMDNQKALVEEIAADEFANNFTDKTWWEELHNKNASLFKKLMFYINKFIDKINAVEAKANNYLTTKQAQAFAKKQMEIMESVMRGKGDNVPSKNDTNIDSNIKTDIDINTESKQMQDYELPFSAKRAKYSAKRNPQTETESFKKWFGDSKVVNENGEPLVVWHQTSNSAYDGIMNGGFKRGLSIAGKYDNQTPDGFFFKTTPGVVRNLPEGAMIGAYLKVINPMKFTTRNELTNFISSKNDEYASLSKEYKSIDTNYGKRLDEVEKLEEENYKKWWDEVKIKDKNANYSSTFEKEIDNIMSEWKAKINDISKKMKPLINDVFDSLGVDGVYLKNDAGGMFGNNVVDAWIVFSPTQIKSATGNVGTFDANNSDIRYSGRRIAKDELAVKIDLQDIVTDELKNAKDPKGMFAPSRLRLDSAQRVFERYFGKDSKAMNILQGGKTAEADMIRWQADTINKIKGLGIKSNLYFIPGKRFLSRISKESQALMWYAEKMKGLDPYGLDELKADLPKSWEKIVHAEKVLREIYDSTIKLANQKREALGYPPIPFRKNYIAHMQQANGLFEMFGVSGSDIPTAIAGMTDELQPWKPFFANEFRRVTNETEVDAIGNTIRYINGIGRMIYMTEYINSMRMLEKGVRENYSQHQVITEIEKINELMKDREASGRARFSKYYEEEQELLKKTNKMTDNARQKRLEEVKRMKIKAVNETNEALKDMKQRKDKFEELLAGMSKDGDSATHLSVLAGWLKEYTNLVAGKNARIDRITEELVRRKGYSWYQVIDRQLSSAYVGYNVGSATTNVMPLVNALSQINKISVAKGMFDAVRYWNNADGLLEKSDFLSKRLIDTSFTNTMWGKAIDYGFVLMRLVDKFSASTVFRAKYYEGLGQGKTESEAIKQANMVSEKIMADRSATNVPVLFKSKLANIVVKFQLEQINNLQNILGDNFKTDWSKDAGKLGKQLAEKNPATYNVLRSTYNLLNYFALAYVLNLGFLALLGRKPAFDLLGLFQDLMKIFGDEKETEGKKIWKAVKKFAEQIPFAQTLTGGRVPISGALPDLEDYFDGKTTAWTETKKPLKLLLPGGGGQIAKTVEGINTVKREGYYKNTPSGEALQYSVEKTPLNMAKSAVFGRGSLPETRKFSEEGGRALNAKQTLEQKSIGVSPEDYLLGRDLQTQLRKAKTRVDENKIKSDIVKTYKETKDPTIFISTLDKNLSRKVRGNKQEVELTDAEYQEYIKNIVDFSKKIKVTGDNFKTYERVAKILNEFIERQNKKIFTKKV